MKKKKLLSLLLAGAMSASIFVGCGSSATDWDYISNKGELVLRKLKTIGLIFRIKANL